MHLFHSDTRAANSSLHGLAATFHLELNPAIAHVVRRYAHCVRSTRAATWICHDVQTRISADDRFVGRVAPGGRANHFYHNTHWREPYTISNVILAFRQFRDTRVHWFAQVQLRGALRRAILQALDAPTLLSTAVTRDAWLWEGECALVAALRTRAGLGMSDASGWLYPSSKASPGALSLHTESTL